jgi:two-component system, LytTR family, sensor kinase
LRNTLEIKSSETIPLEKELHYIDQFINLQQLVGKNTPVSIEKNGIFKHHKILPRILINYLENAFKYGVSNNELKPIKIKIEQIENNLHFNISNYKKKKSSSLTSTKTGNINARQQLDLFYPNNYSILISEDDLTYNCNLKIKLQPL